MIKFDCIYHEKEHNVPLAKFYLNDPLPKGVLHSKKLKWNVPPQENALMDGGMIGNTSASKAFLCSTQKMRGRDDDRK